MAPPDQIIQRQPGDAVVSGQRGVAVFAVRGDPAGREIGERLHQRAVGSLSREDQPVHLVLPHRRGEFAAGADDPVDAGEMVLARGADHPVKTLLRDRRVG